MKDEKEKKVVRVKLVRHKWPDEIAAEKAKKRRLLFSCVGAVLFFVVGFFSAAMVNPVSQVTSSGNQKLNDVYDVMMNKWYFGKDIEQLGDTLLDRALSGMASNEKDPFTQYLTRKDALELSSSLQGSVSGIGIEYLSMHESGLSYVERVVEHGPAEKAGMKAGDMIVSVDGKAVKGMDIDAVQNMILGESGTLVTIEVLRENQLYELPIKRSTVNSSVIGKTEGEIGILSIRSFAENSGKVTGEYLAQFENSGVKDLIIDLRGNVGGYLNATVEIADYLLPKGSIVLWEEVRDGSMTETKTPGKSKHYAYDKIVVLVDEKTASASEVLAAALKEHLDVTLVGKKTYGKGTVQITMPFDDGSAFKYTVAQWLTPNKAKIHETGITVDVEVDNQDVFYASPLYTKESYQYDSVSNIVMGVQMELRFLGYEVDRVDGYFSEQTVSALKQYQHAIGMNENGIIDQTVLDALFSSVKQSIARSPMTYDLQFVKAMQLLED